MQHRAILLFARLQLSFPPAQRQQHFSSGAQSGQQPHFQAVRRCVTFALSDAVPEQHKARKRRRDVLFSGREPRRVKQKGPPLLQQHTLQAATLQSPNHQRQQVQDSPVQTQPLSNRVQTGCSPLKSRAVKAQGSISTRSRSDEQAEAEDGEPKQQYSTVRMSRLPGGKVVNGKASPGFVTLRSGKEISCPKCEGSGWVGGGSKGQPCDVCSIQKAGELLEMAAAHYDEESDEQLALLGNGTMNGRPSSRSQETRRKASVTSGGRQKKCSLCGELGHNKATCPQNPDAKAPEAAAEAAKEAQRQREQERARQRGDTERRRFKGVSWNKSTSKWRAQIWNPYKNTVEQKGYYNEELQAARAHDVAVLELRGPNAITNFPPEDYNFDARAWHRGRQAERDRQEALQSTRSVDATENEDNDDEAQQEEMVIPQRMAVPSVFPLPSDQITAEALAAAAIHKAHNAGIRRQVVEFYLPEGDEGWPGGVRQQFAAAQSLLEGTIRDVKRLPPLQGRMNAVWLDEMERIGMWQNDAMAAVVFPSAETLPELRRLDAQQQRLLLIFNPQWQTTGQLVSDFGFGRSARDAEAFLESFEDVYVMRRLRIDGDNVILFKCFPGRWQVHYQWQNGKGDLLVARQDKRPTYAELVDILRKVPGSRVSQAPSWVDKVRPFFLGMASGGSLLPSKAKPALDDDTGLFEREPQTGDMLNTGDSQQILGGQSIDIRQSNSKQNGSSLSERAGMQREEAAPAQSSEPAPAKPLDMEILDFVSVSSGNEAGRESAAARESERVHDDTELLTTQQAANKAGVSPAELTAMRAQMQPMERRQANGRFDQFDIVTGLPVRDVRMEPLAAIAAWKARAKNLFGSADLDQTSPGRPETTQARRKADKSSTSEQ